MALREGDRLQVSLLPAAIEDYVSESDPVRVYDMFVDGLNRDDLGLVVDRHKPGCPAYDPIAMLKLLVYGYSYGIRSSRKLEQATHHNLSFIWLMGGLRPDHKTIARFRKSNHKVLRQVLKGSAKMCLKLGLIEGHTLFVDGSKFRGNCGASKQLTEGNAEKLLAKLDERIKHLLNECAKLDERESSEPSHQALEKQLKSKKAVREKVQVCLDEMRENGLKQMNRTDRDSTLFKGRQGSHAGYNVQSSVDEKHGLIVAVDVVNEANDRGQLAQQVQNAEETLGREVEQACADSGYENIDEQAKLVERGTQVIVPTQAQASSKPPSPFDHRQFTYDALQDCYYCPEGEALNYVTIDKETSRKVYRITDKSACLMCCHYGSCTKDKKGRSIKRHPKQEMKATLEALYRSDTGQSVYKKRGTKAELPFGYVKHNVNMGSFLMRGLEEVKSEASLMFATFNLKRMITLLNGFQGWATQMNALSPH